MRNLKCIQGAPEYEKYIYDCINIDSKTFKETNQVTVAKCLEWFRHNPNIYSFVVDADSNKAVAYINAMPLTDGTYNDLLAGTITDLDILSESILQYEEDSSFNIYICSMVIDAEYQNTRAFTLLYDSFMDKLDSLVNQSISVKRVITKCVSEKGKRMARLSKLEKYKESTDGSVIYTLDDPLFRFKPMSCKAADLKEKERNRILI